MRSAANIRGKIDSTEKQAEVKLDIQQEGDGIRGVLTPPKTILASFLTTNTMHHSPILAVLECHGMACGTELEIKRGPATDKLCIFTDMFHGLQANDDDITITRFCWHCKSQIWTTGNNSRTPSPNLRSLKMVGHNGNPYVRTSARLLRTVC